MTTSTVTGRLSRPERLLAALLAHVYSFCAVPDHLSLSAASVACCATSKLVAASPHTVFITCALVPGTVAPAFTTAPLPVTPLRWRPTRLVCDSNGSEAASFDRLTASGALNPRHVALGLAAFNQLATSGAIGPRLLALDLVAFDDMIRHDLLKRLVALVPNLESLVLRSSRFIERAVTPFRELTRLRQLTFENCVPHDDSFDFVPATVQTLHFAFCDPKMGHGVKWGRLSQLRALTLPSVKRDVWPLLASSRMPHLRVLSVAQTPVEPPIGPVVLAHLEQFFCTLAHVEFLENLCMPLLRRFEVRSSSPCRLCRRFCRRF
jgi:hypothetical protein